MLCNRVLHTRFTAVTISSVFIQEHMKMRLREIVTDIERKFDRSLEKVGLGRYLVKLLLLFTVTLFSVKNMSILKR